jgi:hypothetical protein
MTRLELGKILTFGIDWWKMPMRISLPFGRQAAFANKQNRNLAARLPGNHEIRSIAGESGNHCQQITTAS